jgi:hypothetical protein
VVWLTRSQALEDARDLVEVLVDAHPDPYSGFGGALAFYRGFHTLVKNLPEGESILRVMRQASSVRFTAKGWAHKAFLWWWREAGFASHV